MTPDMPADDYGERACYGDGRSGGSADIRDGITPYLDVARDRQHAAFEPGERPGLPCGTGRATRPLV